MRLFVSLRPPADAVAHLARAASALRTTDVAQWHVTLAFLGEVAHPAPLLPALADAVGRHPPLRLRMEGSGTFRAQGGVVYAGVSGDVGTLHRLQGDVADACRAAGVHLAPRPYRPHVTVARRTTDQAALAGYRGPDWTASEVELVRSHLGKRAVHEVLHAFPLGG